MLAFAVSNSTSEDKEVRLLTFYPEAPGRQYGRDAWIPAKATLSSWSCLAGPPSLPAHGFVELKSFLYDRTRGRDQLVRSPDGPPAHSELVQFYRREPGTALMLDVDVADGSQAATSPRDEAQAADIRDLVRVFRHRMGWSPRLNAVKQRYLPPVAEAFDGIDHFVLGSDRIANDPAGRQALRAWLERGGTLWVLLDLVHENTVAALLGDILDFQVVDRVSLTNFHLRGGPENARRVEAQPTDLEEPVEFVRVVVPQQQVLYTINGWPAAFLSELGRGRVIVTTLGARGWMRPRRSVDPPSRYQEYPRLSVALAPFDMLMDEIHPRPERPLLAAEDLHSYVSDQIGYSVVGRDTVVIVFGSLFLVLSIAAVLLGKYGLLEHLGWLGTALALGAAVVFVSLGAWSRGAVPPTVAMAQIVDAVPGLDEAQATGFLGVYQPALGTVAVGAEQGGDFDLDIADLAGRDQRRVQTDLDRWHWENLELPAGVRTGPFRHSVRTHDPVEATARFGEDGVEGRVALGPFGLLQDPLMSTPGQHAVAVRLDAAGAFRAGGADELPAGQFMVGGLLSDRQRARQALYAKLLAEPQPRFIAHRNLLLAWAEPVDMHFTLASQPRTTGSALLMIPLRFERTSPGTRVTIPAAFVDCRRLTTEGQSFRATSSGRDKSEVRFRFQVPAPVLPLEVERARLTIRLSAAARDVVISGFAAGALVPLRKVTSPLGVEQIDIDDTRILQPDEQGTIQIQIALGDSRGAEQDSWRIESLGLEVHGKTLGQQP